MKRPKYLFVYLFTIIGFLSCNSDDSNNNNDPEALNPLVAYEEFNISYGNDSDQVFDLYLPANRSSNTKTVILVHGGGWTAGDKADMNAFKDYIKTQMTGYAIVNMNYRLADENNPPYPMQINDITTVVDYLEANENYYSISDDIGFIGTSAGAHLSLLWSYAFDGDSQVEMVCSVVGPTNFTDPAYTESNNPVFEELFNTFGIDATTEFLEDVSPYHRVTSSAPPTILFYGGQDPLIPTTQGTDMRDKLEALNVTHEFTLYPNEGHGWIGLNLLDTTLKLHNFIETYM
ncbi:alpha/beta hydrolase [Winogradskyella ouciana]|uniref:Alpha/beta hydrolase fold domain-containing protein n=1 Tax=Winogradskyella ouciana TaxID=2608631 RepID=A0A7K1G9R2_9FLAO|nr:alpha/beta hydrolase [Winogradskyella ouciana]MTE26032.1 alpha/beta hydrolase fold domain-containing protein [Winogradskyella ouciana]